MKKFLQSCGYCLATLLFSLYSAKKVTKTRLNCWGFDVANLTIQIWQGTMIFCYVCSNACFEHENFGFKICEPTLIWFQLVFSLQDRVLTVFHFTIKDHIRILPAMMYSGLHKIGVAFALWHLWPDRRDTIIGMYFATHFGLFWHLKTAKEVMMLVHHGKMGRPHVEEKSEDSEEDEDTLTPKGEMTPIEAYTHIRLDLVRFCKVVKWTLEDLFSALCIKPVEPAKVHSE